jgi:RNA binding exosome subunit
MTTTFPTDADISILCFFIRNNNEPTNATNIANKSGNISNAWSQKRCPVLEKNGALTHDDKRPPRSKHDTKYFYIPSTVVAMRVLCSGVTERPRLHAIMRSGYYGGMIQVLVDHFRDNLRVAGMPDLTEIEIENLKFFLVRSESCLHFVLEKTPSECKETFEKLEDRAKQQRDAIIQFVDEKIDGDPTFIKTIHDYFVDMLQRSGIRRISLNKATMKTEIRDATRHVINTFVSPPPSWQIVFYNMARGDSIRDGLRWTPDDESAATALLLDSLSIFSPTNQ